MSSNDKYDVGDVVLLGEHEGDGLTKNWASPEMDAYVGKQTTITATAGISSYRYYYVDIDHGMWAWRGVNMTLVKSVKETIKAPEVYGARCSVCKEVNNYQLISDTFTCYRCKH
jgi:hypothetical protein